MQLDASHVRSDREDTPLFPDPTRTLVLCGDCPRCPGQDVEDIDGGGWVRRERRVHLLTPAVVRFGAGLSVGGADRPCGECRDERRRARRHGSALLAWWA